MLEEKKMEIQKKILTRVKLINWHYFANETVTFHGSALVTGENAAGKSTILDAIQLVLTTNTRKFNAAANEKGNRDLKGYVRGKLGNIGETYLRKNVVVSNVALEFYEEKTDKYFVLGVHMTSPDEEGPVATRWYTQDCRLEDFAFLVEQRPATFTEFYAKGERVKFIEQKNAAREQFKRKMGYLEERFFEIIPKSLAFKPMDNVKDFINKFVLSDVKIDVEELRENIETLSELEGLINRSKEELSSLDSIIKKYEEVKRTEGEIHKNDFIIDMSEIALLKQEIEKTRREIESDQQNVLIYEKDLKQFQKEFAELDEKLITLRADMQGNEANQLVQMLQNQIRTVEGKLSEATESRKQFENWMEDVRVFLAEVSGPQVSLLSQDAFVKLLSTVEEKEKVELLQAFEEKREVYIAQCEKNKNRLELQMEQLELKLGEMKQRLEQLEEQKLQYPKQTTELKKSLEEEFRVRGIETNVYVLAELLEITDVRWQNVVEGYLNTQKFYLVVEPEYYSIALEVYRRKRDVLHTAGIINSKRLTFGQEVPSDSLAAVVQSDNRYAKAYTDFILGRVTRCDHLEQLEQTKIGVTAEGMLYQGFVVRNMDPKTYQNPYIGQHAYRVQLEATKKKLQNKAEKKIAYEKEWEQQNKILKLNRNIKTDLIKTCLNAGYLQEYYNNQLHKTREELQAANQNPTLIELQIKLEQVQKERQQIQEKISSLSQEMGSAKASCAGKESLLSNLEMDLAEHERKYHQKSEKDIATKLDAGKAFEQMKASYNGKNIVVRIVRDNEKKKKQLEELLYGEDGLTKLQDNYNYRFEKDFMRGTVRMSDYFEARRRLETVEVVRFQENVLKAKADCEEIFKSDFLAKMREQIQNAKNEFKSLDAALRDVYYGEDSYHFKITCNKEKENLYKMIMSDKNIEGYHLWTEAFEEEYKEEMEELFAKLTSKENNHQKILEEYTDYRSYLDYDIEIYKKDGTVQRFSDIYGEKSGSETQVPYYVAIAASFHHLYRLGNTVRIMLLDEAFDKMDDERIASMLDFLNSLDLQVIMATPPGKIEVIGEKVDTILTAIRIGKNSIVENYSRI